MRILILEDNQYDADLTSRKIKEKISGSTVDIVGTVKDAEKIIGNHYDIALLDYQLPDGFGIDLIPALINFDDQTIIIVLTGSGNEDIAVAALQAGADDYLVKKEDYLDQVADKVFYHLRKTATEKISRVKTIRVLYVEHHKADIDLTLLHFKRYAPNFIFTTVALGSDAIKNLSKKEELETFDVLLMDYKLPGLDAIEITKIIRQELKLDIAIVIITGQGSEEIAIQALKLGANEYLVKRENYLSRLPSLLIGAFQKVELKRQSKIIAESEEMFRSIFENHAAIKLIIKSETGQIFSANNAASVYYGWSIEELKEMTIYDINALPHNETELLLEKIRTKGKLRSEIKHRHVDGSVSDVMVFSSKIVIKGNEYLHSIIYDISRRKQAEKKLQLLNAATEQSPVSTVITDSQGIIEYANPYFLEISGYSLTEALGKKPSILNSGTHERSFFESMWKTITAGQVWQGDICNKKKNGELYWENAIISPIRDADGKIGHFVGIKQDITEKRKLLHELVHAKERAEESDRLKSAFLANMSHEIRTPMNGILGFTDLLHDPDLSDESKDEYISIIHQSGERMLSTVNDIIEISKIEAGMVSINYSMVSIQKVLTFIERFYQPETQKKGIALKVENDLPKTNIMIITDQGKFESILNNLIKNAIKFTDTGNITVVCRLKGEFIEFCVEDSGIGIPAKRQKAVFNRFEQADIDDKRAFQGSGLGLAIAKSYVDMLGGNIWLESEQGLGSKFFFSLPIVSEKKASGNNTGTGNSGKETLPKNQLKILIVEDDVVSAMFLKTIVKDIAKKITLAYSGEEALKECKNNMDYDVILMDIKMPGINGFETTRQIRALNQNVIIIAQTAYAMTGDKAKAIEAGCNDYVSKPIERIQLFEKIQLHLK